MLIFICLCVRVIVPYVYFILSYSRAYTQHWATQYLPSIFGIIFNPELQAIASDSDRFYATMQVIEGMFIPYFLHCHDVLLDF